MVSRRGPSGGSRVIPYVVIPTYATIRSCGSLAGRRPFVQLRQSRTKGTIVVKFSSIVAACLLGFSLQGRLLGLSLSALLAAAPARVFAANTTEPALGTVAADFEPYFAAGRLVGCTLEWRNVLQDELDDNRLIVVDALLTFAIKGRQLAFSLKTRPSDAQQDSSGGLQTTAFSPVYAYPVFGNYSGAHKESFRYQCEGPGFCSAYTAADGIAAMIAAVSSGTFQVWYQRTPNSVDVPSPTRLETGPSSPVHAFGLCIMGILDQLK